MPAIINYTVTETREVKVRATSPSEAQEIAFKAFAGESTFNVVRTPPETIRLEIEKDF